MEPLTNAYTAEVVQTVPASYWTLIDVHAYPTFYKLSVLTSYRKILHTEQDRGGGGRTFRIDCWREDLNASRRRRRLRWKAPEDGALMVATVALELTLTKEWTKRLTKQTHPINAVL